MAIQGARARHHLPVCQHALHAGGIPVPACRFPARGKAYPSVKAPEGRTTREIDFLGRGLPNDEAGLIRIIAAIATIPRDGALLLARPPSEPNGSPNGRNTTA